MLRFSPANSKVVKLARKVKAPVNTVYSFDLLSGYSCPGARECKSRAVETNDKRHIVDGDGCKFRCFSASQEVLFPGVWNLRKGNFETLLQTPKEELASLILASLPTNAKVVRLHVAGDFYSQAYFDAWCKVASQAQGIKFYAYTKSILYWLDAKDHGIIPSNLKLVASMGGWHDGLAIVHGLPTVKVVFSKQEAVEQGLEIDTNDYHAFMGRSCALMIHGTQPKGSKGSKIVKAINSKKALRLRNQRQRASLAIVQA